MNCSFCGEPQAKCDTIRSRICYGMELAQLRTAIDDYKVELDVYRNECIGLGAALTETERKLAESEVQLIAINALYRKVRDDKYGLEYDLAECQARETEAIAWLRKVSTVYTGPTGEDIRIFLKGKLTTSTLIP